MTFRPTTVFTISSLLCAALSTTAHAGEHPAQSDVATATATLPAAVLAPAPASRPAPKAGAGRVVGEVLVGVGVGVGVAVGTGALAYATFEDSEDDGWDSLGNFFAGVAIGGAMYPLGVGLGVGMVGNHGDVHGSYGAAIGGAYLGSLGGLLLGAALPADTLGGSAPLLGFLAGAPIGAAIGHTLTLEYDAPGTGLVNVSGNRTRLSIPAVSVTADPARPNGTLTSIRLMDGRF
jgi:hypothetical protein